MCESHETADYGTLKRIQCIPKYIIMLNTALYYNLRTKFVGYNSSLLCVPLYICQYPVFQSNIIKLKWTTSHCSLVNDYVIYMSCLILNQMEERDLKGFWKEGVLSYFLDNLFSKGLEFKNITMDLPFNSIFILPYQLMVYAPREMRNLKVLSQLMHSKEVLPFRVNTQYG